MKKFEEALAMLSIISTITISYVLIIIILHVKSKITISIFLSFQ